MCIPVKGRKKETQEAVTLMEPPSFNLLESVRMESIQVDSVQVDSIQVESIQVESIQVEIKWKSCQSIHVHCT